jgi:hypothetical protein
MGFNAYRPGRVKRGDLLMLGAAALIVAGLLLWVWLG